MKMQQVRYFVALCEEQNFTRAARRCGVAQPSLTRAIQLLEHELGGLLFWRTDRRVELSPLGCAVRPHLRQIDRAAAAAKRAAQRATPGWDASHPEPSVEVLDRLVARRSGRYRSDMMNGVKHRDQQQA
jgi:DNA-binding transcriptional LysR family regulator